MTARVLCRAPGGTVCLPDPRTIMIDRRDGGQLVVNPPRRVWDRTALSPADLVQWHYLTAAVARAMLETLPQLDGGCINYWDAGNWALNAGAEPAGPKTAPPHRVLHQHVIGRSRHSADPSWQWGESPFFPAFADRFAWSAGKTALSAAECVTIVGRVRAVLVDVYGVVPDAISAAGPCASCGYPTADATPTEARCASCVGEAAR